MVSIHLGELYTEKQRLFVEFYNYHRFHDARENMIPDYVFFGRQKEVLSKREEIEKQTLQ